MEKIYNTLALEENKPVLKVILNRPKIANAMNTEMIRELIDLCRQLRYQTDIKYVVFVGKGKVFSGGADLSEILTNLENNTLTPETGRLDQIDGHELMSKLENLEQITFAAFNGPAIGGGLALSLGCDFRIMADHTFVSVPEAERGFFYTWGSTPRLVNMVGGSKAKEIIMFCNKVYAEEALRIGLINRMVPLDELMKTVYGMIDNLNKSPFLPIRLTKKVVNATTAAFGNLLIYEPELIEQTYNLGAPQKSIKEYMENKKVNRIGNTQ